MLSVVTGLGSCKSKKVFNGTSSLDCTTFESEVAQKEQKKPKQIQTLAVKRWAKSFWKKNKRGKKQPFLKKKSTN